MFLNDDGIRLNAQLDMPVNFDRHCSLVIIIHGFTGHMEEMHITALSRACNEAGYATLRADMYGHGKSEGRFHDHNLFKWLNNILTIMDYAKTLDFVDHIYLCGHSQGGLAVMLAAPMLKDKIAGLIPLSPAWMIPEGARHGTLLGQSFDPVCVPDVLPAWNNQTLSGNYVRVAQTIHVEEAIDAYEGPVLIVHGTLDGAVPVSYGQKAAELYKNARLVLIQGDDHCYGLHLDLVTKAVTEWLAQQQN